jgi:sulfide dehydrogenase [flavocytochrome c] flavoprotein subunit
MQCDRREFLKLAGAVGLAGILPKTAAGGSVSKGRVVVVGGGYAGATAAKYLRKWSRGGIEVILVERNPSFISCPLSNLVLGGSRSMGDLTFGYDRLISNYGIRLVRDEVMAVDPGKRQLGLARGELAYDRLVIAPGIDFIYRDLPMLESAEAQQKIPHAWKAGPQTVNLRAQLEAMPDGGVFALSIPPAPYRCPPGPYERVSQVAFYLRQYKPKSKIIVLDANPEIVSKKDLFTRVWAELYPGLVEYRPNSRVMSVDVDVRSVMTEFEAVKADVLNVIPPQRAGRTAQMAGLANVDKRWCEVDFLSYESKLAPNVHVIGDSIAAMLPKSAHLANSQAKVCANAIVSLMAGEAPDPQPVFANTCYSFVSDKLAMHIANVYRYDPAKKIMRPTEGGGVSERPSEQEGNNAQYWAQNIWSDVLN